MELRAGGAVVSVEPKVFDILRQLIENRDRVVSRDELIARVWDRRIVSDATVSARMNGRGSGVVGYNVQAAVETEHHLIVAHEVITVGNDRAQLAAMSAEARDGARRSR